MKASHGLVIGKFYPPHAGHGLLIRTAAQQCERVTVIVMAASHESLGLAARVGWLREIHRADADVHVTGIMDDVPMDLEDASIWNQHVALMKQALAQIGAPPVTAVFTSETYGAELARRFDAKPVTLDIDRMLAPVSGTRVRGSVPQSWNFLAAPVRADLALRVVVLGAESTGTTTLSLALAQHLRGLGGAHALTRWVTEYGREYSVGKFAQAIATAQLRGDPAPGFDELQWQSPEFVHIAQTQCAMEQAEAAIGGPVLVCDTDAFATCIWHERYLKAPSADVQRIADSRPGDLYLLTHHEGIPFVQDGLRDGEHIRAWMTQRFIGEMDRTRRPYVVLTGPPDRRLEQAAAAVRELLDSAWNFRAPFG